jgi:ABC-type glutathione transport system ATPase component
MSAPVLAVRDLAVRYAGATHHALRDVRFELQAGQCLAIVGESGCGKSSLALALCGLLPRSAQIEGEMDCADVTYGLADHAALARVRGGLLGLVWQDPLAALHPLRRVGEQLSEVYRLDATCDTQAARTRAQQALEQLGLPPTSTQRYPHELSGGQRQRVVLALALAGAPRVLIADEATSALDPERAADVLGLLRDTLRARGIGLIVIAHDLAHVAHLADRVLVLREGAMVEQGAAAQVLRAPTHEYVRDLLACRPRLRDNPVRLPTVNTLASARGDMARVAEAAAVEIERAAPAALTAHALGVTYRDGASALSDVSFHLARGEILAVVGASGSGKTSLARALLRLVPGIRGTMRMGEKTLDARGRWRRRVGLVFQDPAASLDPRWRVFDCVAEPLRIAGAQGAAFDMRARVLSLMEEVGLTAEFATRYPHQLSGGQKQRVAIARALAHDPEILVADESVSALDVSVQAQVLNLLKDLRDARGLSVVFIAHDLAAVAFVADRVAVLDHGSLVEIGPVTQVFAAPQADATRRLLVAAQRLALD